MKRIFAVVLTVLLIPAGASAIDLSAKSAVVMDFASGRILLEKNARERRPMASTTKIMTALLALERGRLEDTVTVSARAAAVEGSSIWLESGETLTLENLLYGVMLSSGNDAAAAVAEYIAGSETAFAQLMTERAKSLGALDTSFTNPHGLYDERHYTTAADLALITREALKNPTFSKIAATKNKNIPWAGRDWERSLKNHNKLLFSFEGCDGVKTGYIKKSGRCLVSSATRGGRRLIAVTLNAPNDWNDHKSMLEYCFGAYLAHPVCTEGQNVGSVEVEKGKDSAVGLICENSYVASLTEPQIQSLRTEIIYDKIILPIFAGERLGTMKIYLEGECIGEVALAADRDIAPAAAHSYVEILFLLMRELVSQ